MIVIIGKSGQLAQALVKHLSLRGRNDYVCLGRNDIDITQLASINAVLAGYPVSAIINASAYTAVDQAETEIEASNSINGKALENLAGYAKAKNAYLLHISTDYVFSGEQNTPYLPETVYQPINQYGHSKMLGEQAIMATYPENSAILRTSWVYSEFGNNFVKSMLRLMRERDALNIVFDQVGSPTSADTLAQACLEYADNNIKGIHHVCDLGVTSWFDFAQTIYRLSHDLGLLHKAVAIMPIRSSAYPTPAKRPHYSVLDTSSTRDNLTEFELPYWQSSLYTTLETLKQDS